MGKPVYRRIDADRFERLYVIRIISVQRLKERLRRLRYQLDMPGPSDRELIEAGRAVHPYYKDRDGLQDQIDNLTDQINYLEGMS